MPFFAPCSPLLAPCFDSSARIFFFFLDVRAAFSTGKAAPHSFGSPIEAVVVIRAGEIAHPFALLAHHRIRGVLIHSLGLSGLSSSAFFLRHEHILLIYTPSPTGSAQNNNAKSCYCKSRASLLCCKSHYNLLYLEFNPFKAFYLNK